MVIPIGQYKATRAGQFITFYFEFSAHQVRNNGEHPVHTLDPNTEQSFKRIELGSREAQLCK